MRILCIIDSLGSGGAQRQMSLLARELKIRGHQVELFLIYPEYNHFRTEIDAAGIPVHGIQRNGKNGFSLKVLWSLRRLLKTGFDGIVSFQLNANAYASLARLMLREKKQRLICGERTAAARTRSLATRIGIWLVGLISDKLVVNSYAQAQTLRHLFGIGRKVVVIWNGYRIPDNTKETHRQNGELRLLMVGRQTPVKNGVRVLQALKILHEDHDWLPKTQWAGRKEYDAESIETSKVFDHFLSNHSEIDAKFSLLGEVKNVEVLYKKNNVLILPSLYEGLPNVVCEAMLAGCPVIASNVCDHPRLLGYKEERGLLCDPLSPKSIADAILRFREMKEHERANMACNARQFAEEYMNIERMVMDYESLLYGKINSTSL